MRKAAARQAARSRTPPPYRLLHGLKVLGLIYSCSILRGLKVLVKGLVYEALICMNGLSHDL